MIPIVASVECRSEGSGEERPVAVVLGGRRQLIEAILEDAVIATAEAGEAHSRRLTVALAEEGQLLCLQRRLPDGPWRVFRIA
jgi:hypothetical protein